MLSSITSFFDSYIKPAEMEDSSTGEDKLPLATAALMIELCKCDQEIDDTETRTLIGILKNRYQLSESVLEELISLAEQEAKDATSVYQFTSLFNEEFDYSQKVQLVQNLWEVAYADGNLDRYEEHLIRKVSDLLYVSHSDFIRTKISVKGDSES